MRILAVSGSSGGHIFPAVSFLDALKNTAPGIRTLLVVPKRSRKNDLLSDGRDIRYISIVPFVRGRALHSLSALFRLAQGSLESFFELVDFKPDVVVGFGGIESVPLVMLAWLCRIKTMIHEQNVYPGKANRLLSKLVDKIAVSFPGWEEHFRVSPKKVAFTGNPLRKELARIERLPAAEFFSLQENKFTILVMGGSQGSHSINAGFLKAVASLGRVSGLQIIHISGAADFASVKARYKELGIEARVFSFLKEIQYAYSVADLVISRAGATAITEIAFFRLPAILIPYPFAARHQQYNARVMERAVRAAIAARKVM